ncbi:hypothetical protein B7H17_10670 [Pseudomonas putida]|uniref:Uncharacterized protein n=1 Tax=Pseudomonas putida TaxID=303 RepID=A0A1X0ZYI3_PSEPU|nr:hypothetical protein B7H17_10670 [Pseudomonas putida]
MAVSLKQRRTGESRLAGDGRAAALMQQDRTFAAKRMPAPCRPWSRPRAGVPGTDARYTAAPFCVGHCLPARLARCFDALVGCVGNAFTKCSRL